MKGNTSSKWIPLILLAVALLLWAGLFAAGAYLEPSADAPHRDLRKPLIIMAAMATFLSLWGLALWARARRGAKQAGLRREKPSQDGSAI